MSSNVEQKTTKSSRARIVVLIEYHPIDNVQQVFVYRDKR
jgi:hypothetical protein